MTCGIYGIVHLSSSRWYIGSSKNIEQRFKQHMYDARYIKHLSKFYNTFKKYGKEAFEFFILEETTHSYLLLREKYWIDRALLRGEVFNLKGVDENTTPYNHSIETKEKLRQANLGKKVSATTMAKFRARCPTQETREKLRIAATGYKHSPETKEKLRQIALKRGMRHAA